MQIKHRNFPRTLRPGVGFGGLCDTVEQTFSSINSFTFYLPRSEVAPMMETCPWRPRRVPLAMAE